MSPIFFDTNGFNNGLMNGNTFFGRVYCPLVSTAEAPEQ
jgi:hypothetical protein